MTGDKTKKKEEDKTKKKEEDKKRKRKKNKNDENIIRIISNIILNSIKKLGLSNIILGITYTYIHYLLIFLVAFIFSFNNNITHLFILLIIVSLDALSVVVLHGCPLTHLEKKYLHETSCEVRLNHLKNAKILYKCDHDYEKQIELLINIWMLVASKCLLLIFFNTFNYKLQNSNNIYK